jgi:electron-transferring-flavoprotein dehydrogenase
MAAAEDRERLSTDVVVVGAGPAGLAAAIRLKQRDPQVAVTVVEKAAEVGGHILSGAVMNPAGLDDLLPGWREKGAPVGPEVTSDRLHYLTATADIPLPGFMLPPAMKTPGAVIVSLGELCKWLATEAEALGVEIYPATAAVDVLTNEAGAVAGIITGDLGRDRQGREKPGFARGIALEAKYTLVAEGARGSLARQLLADFDLDKGRSPQKFGLGIKEIWEIPEPAHEPGRVDHYLGFPLDGRTGGGGFCYHAGGRRVFLGLVVHLDYANPTLSPFDEFQRFKRHPAIARLLAGGRRLTWGARSLTSGGWQSIPELAFPGGALIGGAAGFMNVPALKGIHNAMRSGIGAAEAVADGLAAGRRHDRLEALQPAVLATGIEAELYPVRNVKPLWSRFGTAGGVLFAGIDMWAQALTGRSPFGTLRHRAPDAATLRPLAEVAPQS